MSRARLRVAVVYGGRSGEHEVSLRSAESVMRALDREKYDVLPYVIAKDGRWQPRPIAPEPGGNPEIDIVFPLVHGTFGEDGTLQGLIELADLPYVGPGVMGSACAMDKDITKRMLEASGLPVAEWVTLRRGALDASACESALPYPMFVKPANLGSSVGISKARNRAELESALETAAAYDPKVVVERGIAGREFECAVLGNLERREASVPCEIRPKREFYDYEAKYIEDTTEIDLPARIDDATAARIRELAIATCEALELEGMTRVDFLMESATGQLFVNEPNTIPGFTSISMYPKMWEHSGLPYPRLLDRLIELAFDRHERRRATRYSK
jgi:D-alanine-D-alanine ligase